LGTSRSLDLLDFFEDHINYVEAKQLFPRSNHQNSLDPLRSL
jgi:hypothetical protein